jgi:hypothetical protein
MNSRALTIQTIVSERLLSSLLCFFIVCTIPCLAFADTTGLILDGQPNEPITAGTNRYFTSSNGTFTGNILPDGGVGVGFHDSHNSFGAVFRAPAGQILAVGTYDDAANYNDPFDGGPGMEVSGNAVGIGYIYGKFTIKELVITNGVLVRFHAIFSERDTNGTGGNPSLRAGPRLTGEVFFHATDPMPARHHLIGDRVISASQGQRFRFEIRTNHPETSFNAANLPAGLSIDRSTGVITGVPIVHGQFNVGISANGPSGAMSSSLLFNIEAAGKTAGPYTAISLDSAFGDLIGKGPEFHEVSEGDFISDSFDTYGPDFFNFHSAANITFQSESGQMIALHFAAPNGRNLTRGNYYGAIYFKTFNSHVPRFGILSGQVEPSSITGYFQIKEISFYGTSRVKSLRASFTQYSNGSAAPLTGALWFRSENVITSSLLQYAKDGRAFSYQIAANCPASSFSASSLPAGLHVNSSSGLISGTPTQAGTFHVSLGATNGTITASDVLTLIVRPTEFLGNLSTRMIVAPGSGAMIAGFILSGPETKRVLLRALSPSLAASGVQNTITNPTLRLVDVHGGTLFFNDGWQSSAQRAEIQATHLAPHDTRESAIVATLPPGAYTAIETDRYSHVGVGLIEVYDLSPSSDTVFANLSTRGIVRTDDEVMIGGVVLSGQQHTGGRLLVRATGPSLSTAGITNALPNPTLQLFNANGVSLAFNDNWRDAQSAQIAATGLAPSNLYEPAILITRPLGPMTAIVRGMNNTIGIALVEVYDLP